ncbi:peptidase [Cytobacillus gottheilii]|uniref:Peptidase n=1 Tax=Cytobacillus gottheilii TaxID=859144 RepID=A0ABX8F6H6_9BACI|nr:peptidase [Cytobacillus gottheilii]
MLLQKGGRKVNTTVKIKQWLHKNEHRGIKLLQQLVQENSVRENESSAQAVIIEKCRKLGLELDIWEIGSDELKEHQAFYCDRKDFSGTPNVVAVKKGSGGGKSIILNGHIDVVPEGNEKDWIHHPYSAVVENGKLYGRGSTDMKGGTVALLLAMEAISSVGVQLKGDIIFQSVIEEESGGAGTLAAILRGYKADGAIIPEPTNMKIFPKQQGSMWFRITVKGKSAHGGTRYEGVNAIEKSILVMNALNRLEKMRNDQITDPLYKNIPIPIPINIGKITSGQWPSSVPDLAWIEGRIGVAPHEKMEDAAVQLETCLKELADVDPWFKEFPAEVEWFGARWQPGNLETNHELIQTVAKAYKKVKGIEPVIEASPWGTDGGLLANVGNTPVVVIGPGVTAAAHDVNEYIELKEVFTAAEVIAEAIMNWCEIRDEQGD